MLPGVTYVILPAIATFSIGILFAPILAHYLYAYRAWKKRPGKVALDGNHAEVFNQLHRHNEVRAPRMGGILVWGSVLLSVIVFAAIATYSGNTSAERLNFLSRGQTWLPFAALLAGAIVGLVDDLLVIRDSAEGLRLRVRLLFVVALSTFIGSWFYFKLGVSAVNIPYHLPLELGLLIIPLFVIISLALYASGVIDGIDGLSGGVFATIFASYAIIAYAQNQIDLAGYCASLVGGLLAFLWFNIPPARFYMSDTGTMALTLSLAVVAFMTDNRGGGYGIVVLPVIGALLVITVASILAQMAWKRFLGRKLLHIAPLHHHFEAIGWPAAKVTMRYWVLALMFACGGVIIALAAL